MTHEELIRELRNSKGWPNLGNAAADCIEQLVKEQSIWQKEALRQNGLMHNAMLGAAKTEAKLAKAVEALRKTDQNIMFYTDDTSFRVWGEDAVIDIRNVLAELEKTE
jgi:hypothetical protein